MAKRLAKLHFLARQLSNDKKLRRLSDEQYETGNWRVAASVPPIAIGAEIHLHERQRDLSWIAGRIDSYRWHEVETGRVVFRFTRYDRLRCEQPDGWGRGSEKKYVWED